MISRRSSGPNQRSVRRMMLSGGSSRGTYPGPLAARDELTVSRRTTRGLYGLEDDEKLLAPRYDALLSKDAPDGSTTRHPMKHSEGA
jgi:hypothetical protein